MPKVYAITTGTPKIAIMVIYSNVFWEAEALYIVKLYAGLLDAKTKLGNNPIAVKAKNITIAPDDDINAKKYCCFEIALGIFAIASKVITGIAKSTG